MNEVRERPDSSARWAVLLEAVSVVVALGEALAALISGLVATSFALIAFGADSVIEVLFGLKVKVRALKLLKDMVK